VVYRADAAACNACPLKADCTASDEGRQVRRSFYADYLDRVRGYHETPAYEKAMRKRKVWVEPLFGEAKQWHGLRHRFGYRMAKAVPLHRLAQLMGHDSLDTTRIYVASTRADFQEAVETIAWR
jgi:integrase